MFASEGNKQLGGEHSLKMQDTTEEHAKSVQVRARGESALVYTETDFPLSLVYIAANCGGT